MLSCREFVELFLFAWHERELQRRRRRECDEHLAGCAACRQYAQGYQRVVAVLRTVAADEREAPAELPPDLVQAILLHPRAR